MTFFKPADNTANHESLTDTQTGRISQEHFIFALSLFVIGLTSAMLDFSPVEAKVSKTTYVVQCSDSDGSKTITQGATKLSQLNQKTKKQTQVDLKNDQCITSTKVREYICSFDKKTQTNQLKFIDITCGGGQYCSKGACIPLPQLIEPTTNVIAPLTTVAPTIATPTVTAAPSPATSVAPKQTPAVYISGETPLLGDTATLYLTNNSHIGRFKITNASTFPVTITSLNITDSGTHWGTSATFKLYYSDEGSSNFTAFTAESGNITTNFTSLSNGGFTINGGTSRYITVAIDNAGDLISGDFFNLSIARLNDVQYSLREIDWGYDANGNSTLNDTISGLFVDGRPTLGTLIKQ